MIQVLVLIVLFGILVFLCSHSFREKKPTRKKGISNIPKQIFLTSQFNRDALPKEIEKNIQDMKRINPEYNIYYYSDSDAEQFIQSEFPQYLNEYRALIPGAYKADLLRLLLLYKFGGVYNDIGHVYLEPLDTILGGEKLLLCKDKVYNYFLHNAIIASVPEHPMIQKAIDVLIDNVRQRYYGTDPLFPTGPGAFGKAFNLYLDREYDETIHSGQFNEDIKILYFPGEVIQDIDGRSIIRVKFENYTKVMYSDRPKYGELWYARKIYTDGN